MVTESGGVWGSADNGNFVTKINRSRNVNLGTTNQSYAPMTSKRAALDIVVGRLNSFEVPQSTVDYIDSLQNFKITLIHAIGHFRD